MDKYVFVHKFWQFEHGISRATCDARTQKTFSTLSDQSIRWAFLSRLTLACPQTKGKSDWAHAFVTKCTYWFPVKAENPAFGARPFAPPAAAHKMLFTAAQREQKLLAQR